MTNGGDFFGLFNDVLARLLHELTGVTLPARPTPPAEPQHVDPTSYLGHYADTIYDIRVSQDAEGRLWLDREPKDVLAEIGEKPLRFELVHLAGTPPSRSRPTTASTSSSRSSAATRRDAPSTCTTAGSSPAPTDQPHRPHRPHRRKGTPMRPVHSSALLALSLALPSPPVVQAPRSRRRPPTATPTARRSPSPSAPTPARSTRRRLR